MRKTAYTVPILVFLMGAAGFILRKKELATAFEEGTGFAKQGEPITLFVIGLAVFAAVFAIISAVAIMKGRVSDIRYEKAFSIKSFLGLLFYTLLGLAILAAAVLYFFENKEVGIHTMAPEIVFCVFAALSGIAVILMAASAFRGKSDGKCSLFSILPPLFLCFWLIMLYKENASNPVLLEFCYRCMALAASALAFYYIAGYVYNRARPRMTICTSLFGVFCCMLSLADSTRLSHLILYGAVALVLLLQCFYFIKNMQKV